MVLSGVREGLSKFDKKNKYQTWNENSVFETLTKFFRVILVVFFYHYLSDSILFVGWFKCIICHILWI